MIAPSSRAKRSANLLRRRRKTEKSAAASVPVFAYASFIVLFLMLILGPALFNGSDFAQVSTAAEGSTGRQFGYLLAFGLAFSGAGPLRNPARLAVVPSGIVIALGWCAISIGWAIAPEVAARRLMLTALVIWTAFAIVRQLGYHRTLSAIRCSLLITLVGNFLMIALWPAAAIHQFDPLGDPAVAGTWHGLLPQKNFTGALCAVTILMFVFDSRRVASWLRVLVIAAALFFLFKTGSKTSLNILVGVLIIGVALIRYNPTYRSLLIPVAMIAIAAISLLFLLYLRVWLDALEDPTSLTGRGQIWNVLIRYAQDNPWLGAGYGSFWGIGDRSPVYLYTNGFVAKIFVGHNGYLDLLTQVGIPGVALIVIATFVVPIVSLLASFRKTPAQIALLMSIILFSLGHNFTESSLFNRDEFLQVFLMLAIALSRENLLE